MAPSETVGRSSNALSNPWDTTVTTRSNDNTEVTSTAPIGRPGIVSSTDAGFCWITSISGSFRGMGEYANIGFTGTGYYKAIVRSNTSYDSTSNVGPIMSMRCRYMTDFIDSSHVSDFSATGYFAGGSPPSGGVNYGQVTTSVTSGSVYPWAGLEGRLGDAGSATWMMSAMDHGSDTAFARWAQSCPLGSNLYCQMSSSAVQVYSASHTWTYSVTGASASNTADVQLISASGQECLLDGAWGFWTSTSSAQVVVEGDGYWHLVTAKGSGALGMGAYAACFPLAQGF